MWERASSIIAFAFALALTVLAFTILFTLDAQSQGFHGDGHDKMHSWYRTLKQPSNGASCCNDQDCRPTDSRIMPDGSIQAKLDGRWVTVPKEKILRVSPPDLNSHICAPDNKSGIWPKDHIFCFVFGAGV